MTRFTVRLDDNGDLDAWLEDQAEQRDRSKAWIVREALKSAAGLESVYADAHRTGADRTGGHHTDANNIDALRDRIAKLEEEVYTQHGHETPEEPKADTSTEERVAAAVDAVANGWEDTDARLRERRQAAESVLQHAIDTGDAIGKSDALEDFHSEYSVDGQTEETWWRQNIRPVLSEYGAYSNGAHGYTVLVDDLPK